MKIGRSHVPVGEPVVLRVEFGMRLRRLQAKGIEIGDEMPSDPVGADQHEGAEESSVACRISAAEAGAPDAAAGGPSAVSLAALGAIAGLGVRILDTDYAGGFRRPTGPDHFTTSGTSLIHQLVEEVRQLVSTEAGSD